MLNLCVVPRVFLCFCHDFMVGQQHLSDHPFADTCRNKCSV